MGTHLPLFRQLRPKPLDDEVHSMPVGTRVQIRIDVQQDSGKGAGGLVFDRGEQRLADSRQRSTADSATLSIAISRESVG